MISKLSKGSLWWSDGSVGFCLAMGWASVITGVGCETGAVQGRYVGERENQLMQQKIIQNWLQQTHSYEAKFTYVYMLRPDSQLLTHSETGQPVSKPWSVWIKNGRPYCKARSHNACTLVPSKVQLFKQVRLDWTNQNSSIILIWSKFPQEHRGSSRLVEPPRSHESLSYNPCSLQNGSKRTWKRARVKMAVC